MQRLKHIIPNRLATFTDSRTSYCISSLPSFSSPKTPRNLAPPRPSSGNACLFCDGYALGFEQLPLSTTAGSKTISISKTFAPHQKGTACRPSTLLADTSARSSMIVPSGVVWDEGRHGVSLRIRRSLLCRKGGRPFYAILDGFRSRMMVTNFH